jgi:hypothetical protein
MEARDTSTGLRAFTLAEPRDILRILNAKGLPAAVLEGVLERRAKGGAPVSIGALMAHPSMPLDLYPGSELPRSAVIATRLRSLVDEWLDSGRKPDGEERPDQRRLAGTREALATVKASAATTPCRLIFIERTGELVVGVDTALASPDSNPYSRLDVFKEALAEADRMFTEIMAGEWKYQFCKCRQCGQYFLLPKPRRSYRHGTFCSREHQRHASAAALTKERRERIKVELLKYAAQWLRRRRDSGRGRQGDYGLKEALAAALSERISRDPNLRAGKECIKVNWVTRHMTEIEKRCRELVTLR